MHDSRFDHSADDGSDERDRECVVDVKLKGSGCVVIPMVGQDVKELTHERERLASHIGNLENRADALTDKLRLYRRRVVS